MLRRMSTLLGLAAPDAAAIIHLCATSFFVTDNADLIIFRDAMDLLIAKIVCVISELSNFAQKFRDLPYS